MGGDTFQGVQKLTNQQYVQYVAQIMDAIEKLCQRIQPYIALPQKKNHGDIDFLIILKKQYKPMQVIECLKLQKFKMNNNDTINSVYKNKQVDFCFVEDKKQFTVMSFYKSYSGIGAYLGMFLPSSQIKLSDSGFYALGFHKHLKLEYLITNDIKTILQFYGLDYQIYSQGFKTRKQLFEYIRNVRFLDQKRFVQKFGAQNVDKVIVQNEKNVQKNDVEGVSKKKSKKLSKIALLFVEYLKQNGVRQDKQVEIYEQPLKNTLDYFHCGQDFQQKFNQLINSKQRETKLNKKFNATHIMQKYNIKAKDINPLKKKFRNEFKSDEEYYNFIEKTQLEEIILKFAKICNLQ